MRAWGSLEYERSFSKEGALCVTLVSFRCLLHELGVVLLACVLHYFGAVLLRSALIWGAFCCVQH